MGPYSIGSVGCCFVHLELSGRLWQDPRHVLGFRVEIVLWSLELAAVRISAIVIAMVPSWAFFFFFLPQPLQPCPIHRHE